MAYPLGDLELHVVSGGRMRLDGGNMFGVIPKVMWSRAIEPDDRNRIPLDTKCLLVRAGDRTLLVDTGYGSKATERERDRHELEVGRPLVKNLSRLGLTPDEIDIVILTHLHFDHVGGCTVLDGSGKVRPTFPRARHIIQRAEWEDASADLPELAGAYFSRDFVPLEEAGQVELIEGDAELLPGVSVRLVGGHTRGHQMVHLASGDRHAIYPCDLCPTSSHLRTFWNVAYDQYPLDQRRIKPRVLGEAADKGWAVLFAHDPSVAGAFLARDPKEQFVIREAIEV